MKKDIMVKASRAFHKVGFQIKKHSPEILMGVGVVGTVASTVLACRATTKATGLIKEAKIEIQAIHTVAERDDKYTEKDLQQALTISYAQTGVKLLKLYAPAIVVGTLSLTSIIAGHKILKKRNIALAAAYTVLDKGFKNYRKNVVERFGNNIDNELLYNIKAKEVETEVIDENGNVVTKKEIVDAVGNPVEEHSPYARFFESDSPYWENDSSYNLIFLRKQQAYANELLRSQGYLFLNDVYEMLGIPKCPYGQIVGWIYDEKNPIGDNYVDFGIYDINKPKCRDFVNGFEKVVLLDFNVDGIIYEHI